MRPIRQILRGIISFRHHYIMKIRFNGFIEKEIESDLILKKVSEYSELIDGTYSINLQVKILDTNIRKCDTFILKDNSAQNTIGTICVMYRGGNELEYKIRDAEAFIYNVMIKEFFRGKGYAGIMIQMLGVKLRKLNIKEAYLAVSIDNHSAIKAYQKTGFEIVSEKKFLRIMKRNFPYYSL